jgi:hypothetical protein
MSGICDVEDLFARRGVPSGARRRSHEWRDQAPRAPVTQGPGAPAPATIAAPTLLEHAHSAAALDLGLAVEDHEDGVRTEPAQVRELLRIVWHGRERT